MCLTIYGASLTNNANAVQYACEDRPPFNERWYIWERDINTYMFVNVHSGLCLTIYHARQDDEAPAVQYTCEYDAPYNERWKLLD